MSPAAQVQGGDGAMDRPHSDLAPSSTSHPEGETKPTLPDPTEQEGQGGGNGPHAGPPQACTA